MEAMHAGEKIVYQGGPSQVVNYNTYTVAVIIFVAAMLAPAIWSHILQGNVDEANKAYYMMGAKGLFFFPIIWGGWEWLKVRCHRYTITTERLLEENGVLSKTTDELELFRVKDVTFMEPFTLRMFGCGNIILNTSDKSTPIVVLRAIKNARPVMEGIRRNVQIMRQAKGVREIDS